MATTGPPGWRKQRWGRRMKDVLDSMTVRARAKGARRNGVDIAMGPYGHPCEVCGGTVDRFHPLHRDERPDRAEPPVIAARRSA